MASHGHRLLLNIKYNVKYFQTLSVKFIYCVCLFVYRVIIRYRLYSYLFTSMKHPVILRSNSMILYNFNRWDGKKQEIVWFWGTPPPPHPRVLVSNLSTTKNTTAASWLEGHWVGGRGGGSRYTTQRILAPTPIKSRVGTPSLYISEFEYK